jgi:hypothetical protein
MRDLGARDPRSMMLRFHTQTAGGTADRPAAGGEPDPRLRAGDRSDPGRHPVPTYELVRRGDRATDRKGRPARTAHAAGARLRDRPYVHCGPIRRLLCRRGHDRPRSRRSRSR